MAYRTEIEKLEQRHAENPKQWFAALADAYRKQGDVDLAIEYVRSGLDLRPDYASAHIVLGRCYLDKNMDDDAAQAFEQVLNLDTENIIALKSLEEIAERRGDFGGARHWLNRLLEVDPMNEEAHESLARLGEQGKTEEPAPPPEALPAPEPAAAPAVAEAAIAAELPFDLEDAVLTVSEDAVFAASVEVESLTLDSTFPMDDSPTAAIEPIELETDDADASSLLAGTSGESGLASADEPAAPVYIEPFELDRTEEDVTSFGFFESIEAETPEADAGSLLSEVEPAFDEIEVLVEEDAAPEEVVEVPMEAEYVLEEVDVPDQPEPVSEEAETSRRASVPPTTEVEAIDLEALRAADEMIARTTGPATVFDAAEVEASGTTEIDAVELDQLRAQDALDSRSAARPRTFEVVVGDAEAAVEEEVVEQVDEELVAEMSFEEDPEQDTSAVGDIVIGTFEEDAGWGIVEADEDAAIVARQDEPAPAAGEPDGIDIDIDSDALPLIMPDDVGDGEALTQTEPEPVVTETMAEVYAKQGLFDQAREIYEVLVMQHPGDSRLKARAEELKNRVEGAIQETRKSRFSIAATGGESAVAYLRRLFAHDVEAGATVSAAAAATAQPEAVAVPESDLAPTPLEEAFADEPAELPGAPTVAAPDEVSLASVFDGGPPLPSSIGEPGVGLDQIPPEPGVENGVSFDEFYGSGLGPTLPEAAGLVDDETASDEDKDFKTWLKGLKT